MAEDPARFETFSCAMQRAELSKAGIGHSKANVTLTRIAKRR
jgi:hypothetical protein